VRSFAGGFFLLIGGTVELIGKYAFRPGCCTVSDHDDENVEVKGPCYSCGQPLFVIVKKADFERFRKGNFASECFPYLNAGQREFLISGICDTCWDEMFGEDEDDEDEDNS